MDAGERIAPQHPKLYHARELVGAELMRAGRLSDAEIQFRKLLDRDAAGNSYSWTAHEGMVWICNMSGRHDEALNHARSLLAHSDLKCKEA